MSSALLILIIFELSRSLGIVVVLRRGDGDALADVFLEALGNIRCGLTTGITSGIALSFKMVD